MRKSGRARWRRKDQRQAGKSGYDVYHTNTTPTADKALTMLEDTIDANDNEPADRQ